MIEARDVELKFAMYRVDLLAPLPQNGSLNCIVRWMRISEPGTDSDIMPLSKHLSQKMQGKQNMDSVCGLEYKKHCIICKNCMHVIICVWWAVLSGPPWGCSDAVESTVPLQMSTVCEVWICGRLADSPSPASPANQPVSNTCCY